MPVGLEETFDGVKVAPDITYTNTFQYPERNSKVASIYLPTNKQMCQHLNTPIKFAKPNLNIIPRPHTHHLYDETRTSIKEFVARGLVRSRLQPSEEESYRRPIAYLHRVPPTTPQHPSKRRSGSKYSTYSARTNYSNQGNSQPWMGSNNIVNINISNVLAGSTAAGASSRKSAGITVS